MGDVVPWLWNERRNEPQSGDVVFFLRAGNPPRKYPRNRPWRGFTGIGGVSGPPVGLEDLQTRRGVPVETIAFSPDDPVPDWWVWHDHRVAAASVLFGQQGTNFAIGQPAAQALARAMLHNDSLKGPGEKLLNAIGPEPGDALTERIERSRGWVNNHVARSLQAARAFSGQSTRRGELTWTHLLIGLIVLGRELRPEARTSALAVALHGLAVPNGDEARFKDYLRLLRDRKGEPQDINRREAELVNRLSPSAAKVIEKAARISGDELITAEALLAALLQASAHQADEVYEELFLTDRNGLIDGLIEGARERCPPKDLERFANWLDRTVPPDTKVPPPEPDEPLEDTKEPPPDAKVPPPEPDEPPEDTNEPPRGEDATVLGPRIAGTLNDTVKRGEDFLDVRHEARAFARLIASNGFEPPLAIGVFGHWGTGKTFFMERIAEALDDLTKRPSAPSPETPSAFHGNIVPIRFNAWHYMETNVWASLVDVIFRELDGWLRRKVADQQRGDQVETLFESLSTAQAERLEAIEAFADRLRDMESARQTLQTANTAEAKHWAAVAGEIVGQDETRKAFHQVAEAFGLNKLADEGVKLHAAIEKTRGAASDAEVLWTSLRSRVSSPLMLMLLTALVLGLPVLLSLLAKKIDIEPTVSTLTGLATAATAWVSIVAARTKGVVAALRTLKTAFDKVEAERSKAKKNTLAHYETKINEAQTALNLAEQAAAIAQRNLRAGSATGRIAAFIRSRAEGDTYAKHLGIIDTIRRDFEQLTALMATSRDQAQREIDALKRQQEDLAMRIEALRARFLGDNASEADNELFRPVGDALDRMKEVNKPENPLGVSIDRIVLFIDDLDRCPPDKVYRVLQAVHLFLNFPLFVIVVGVDTRWMEASLVKELGTLVDGSGGTSAQDYLEKIFQIPYWTRRMDPSSSRGFVGGVLKGIPADLPPDVTEPSAGTKAATGPDGETLGETGSAGVPSAGSPAALTGQARVDDSNGAQEPPAGDEEAVTAEEAGEEEEGSGEEEEDRPEITPRAVVINDDEREMIQLVAPQAGRSPRQLLRFVNVYGLIKSVTDEDGAPLIDPTSDHVTYRALLAQLAIATGSPASAGIYFDALARCSGNFSRLGELIETTPDTSEAELEDLRTIMRGLFTILGIQLAASEKTDGWPLVEDRLARPVLTKLQETAPIARRYTFASIDAILATPMPEDMQDPVQALTRAAD